MLSLIDNDVHHEDMEQVDPPPSSDAAASGSNTPTPTQVDSNSNSDTPARQIQAAATTPPSNTNINSHGPEIIDDNVGPPLFGAVTDAGTSSAQLEGADEDPNEKVNSNIGVEQIGDDIGDLYMLSPGAAVWQDELLIDDDDDDDSAGPKILPPGKSIEHDERKRCVSKLLHGNVDGRRVEQTDNTGPQIPPGMAIERNEKCEARPDGIARADNTDGNTINDTQDSEKCDDLGLTDNIDSLSYSPVDDTHPALAAVTAQPRLTPSIPPVPVPVNPESTTEGPTFYAVEATLVQNNSSTESDDEEQIRMQPPIYDAVYVPDQSSLPLWKRKRIRRGIVLVVTAGLVAAVAILVGTGGDTKSTPDKDNAMTTIAPPGKGGGDNSKNTTDKDDAMSTIAPTGMGGDGNSNNTTDKDDATSVASPFPPPPFTCKVLNFGTLYETDCFSCFFIMATYGTTIAIFREDEETPGINLFLEEDGNKSFSSYIGADYRIRTIVMSDDVIVAGDSYGGDGRSGIVYVYEKDTSGMWNETIQIIPPNIGGRAEFGHSISTDGDFFVVGAPSDRGSTGSAFIYQRVETGGWAQVANLVPEDPEIIARFGHDVAMKGNMVAVAGNLYGSEYVKESVFVYQYGTSSNSAQWRLSDIIINDNCVGEFGNSLEITDDDNLVIGCPLDNDGTGAVYYYKQVDGDDSFSLRQKIAPQEEEGVAVAQFGDKVTVGGKFMAVGTYEEHNGKVYFFVLDEDDYWKRVLRIDAVYAPSSDETYFGYDIELAGNDILIAHWNNVYSYRILCGESDTLSLIYP